MEYLLAAIDLGSNSFRLSVGRALERNENTQIYTIDRLQESVQLAQGLGPDLVLDDAAIDRALTVLRRYGERLAGFHPNRVRAVATNTFRIAANSADILARAEEALGFQIEVISGVEEARLIYTGVAHELPPADGKRLVIDIGGGSTEVIIGKNEKPLLLCSLALGCATLTQRFFPGGRITATRMELAQLAARREFEMIARVYRQAGWTAAYGSSGTAKGLLAILREGGMSDKGITFDGLNQLKNRLLQDGEVIIDHLPGIKPGRAPVLAGGLAIMLAAFHELDIDLMLAGEGALRLGVMYDLVGRATVHDKRNETVQEFMRRYQIDIPQAERVCRLACALHQSLLNSNDSNNDEGHSLAQALSWAASLHEIGMSITHSDYPRHSAYILKHADMPGFSRDDQTLLAWLVRRQQGRLTGVSVTADQWLTLLCLRLAILLCRRREDPTSDYLPRLIRLGSNHVQIKVSGQWLNSHALSDYSLRTEIDEWNQAGHILELLET